MPRKESNCTSSKVSDSLEDDELMANARPVQDANEDELTVAWHEATHLLPPIVTHRLKQVQNAIIKDFKIIGRPVKQGQGKFYCMILKWKENMPTKSYEKNVGRLKPTIKRKMPCNDSRIDTRVEMDSRLSVKHNITAIYPDGCRCSGPCGRVSPINDLTIFGQCDHNICSSCIKALSPLFADKDDPFCCNIACLSSNLIETFAPSTEQQNAVHNLVYEACYENIQEKYDPKGYEIFQKAGKRAEGQQNKPEVPTFLSHNKTFSADLDPTTKNSQTLSYSDEVEAKPHKQPFEPEDSEDAIILSILFLDGSDRRLETSYNYESTLQRCVNFLANHYCPHKKVRVFYEEGDIFKKGRAYFINMDKYGHVPLFYLPCTRNTVHLIFDATNLLQNVKNQYIQF